MSEIMTGGCQCGRVRYAVSNRGRRGVSLPLQLLQTRDRRRLDRLQDCPLRRRSNGPRLRPIGINPRRSRGGPSARRAGRRSASNSSTARIWTSPSGRSTSRPVSARPPTSRSRPRWRPGWTSPTCRASAWTSMRPPSTAGLRPLASSPTELPIHRFKSFDGTELAYREMGPEAGRPARRADPRLLLDRDGQLDPLRPCRQDRGRRASG